MKSLTLLLLMLASSAWGQMLQGVSTSKPPSGTFTLVQEKTNASGGTGTTNAITISTTSANNLLEFYCFTANKVYVTSVDKGGTLIPMYSNNFFRGLGGSGGYILPSSSTAATTPITLTFSGAAGGFNDCRMREIHPSANPNSVALEGLGYVTNTSTASPTGPAVTVTGTNAYLSVNCVAEGAASCSAVASPFNTNALFDANGIGWSYALNQSSGTGAAWALTTSDTSDETVAAFSFNPTACQDVGLLDFSGGTATNNLTSTQLTNSTFGGVGSWGAASGTPASSETAETAAHFNLVNTRTCAGNKTGSGTLGMKFDTSASTSYYFPYTLCQSAAACPYSPFSYGFWYVPHIATSDTGFYSMMMTQDVNGLDFISNMLTSGVMYIETKLDPNGNPLTCTGSSCNGSNQFAFTEDHQYWITDQMNKYVANGTSTSSVAIGTGSKTFTTQAGLGYTAGQPISVINTTANWMTGTVSSYTGTTLIVTVTNTAGSGTKTSWTFSGTMHKMSIYDSDGSTLLAAMQKSAYPTTPTNPDQFHLGRVGDSGTTAGSYIYISNWKLSYAGTFPVLP